MEIKDVYDLLLLIELRPAMYLGKPNLDRLSMFLWGIEFGLRFEDVENSKFDWKQFRPKIEPHYAHGFQSWIAKKLLNLDKSTYDWSYLILEYCNGDEEKAFDFFFTLLEEFKLEKEELRNE